MGKTRYTLGMKRCTALSLIALLALSTGLTRAWAKPNFSGDWKMNAEKSN